MEQKQFKAESKRLLDLMINSIYTHKEIFLRELISNASDAIDKLYYRALTENITGLSRDDFEIRLALDRDQRTITITDNGCGMTRDELEQNLGTIAKSGSLDFKGANEKKEDIDIIGQFGVGFYSAFMVASKVTVYSRAYHSDQAWVWESTGADGYTLDTCDKPDHGTKVVLTIKEDTDEEKYSEYLSSDRLQAIVKKYSDYIRYPIKMDVEETHPKEGSDETETVVVNKTLNSMVPLWKKNRNEIKPEEYNQFYKDKFYDFEDPLCVIHSSTEGTATYNALLFIPARPAYGYYTTEFEKGLQLYANGVLIMDKCADLLPDYFSFVRGLVDSQDLQLNISREMLQHDRQLKLIESRLEKKIHDELQSMLKNDREKYEKFWKNFGLQLKYGVYSDFGSHKELLQDLLLFHVTGSEKPVTLAEYVTAMKADQKYIYYACGSSATQIEKLPQIELLRDHGYEVLCLTDDVDEFVMRVLIEYQDKPLRSISSDDLGLADEEAKKETVKKQNEDHKEMFAAMVKALNGKVKAVRLSTRLKSQPACVTADGPISLEMEKVLNSMPNGQKVTAERVLELNGDHPVFAKLCDMEHSDTDRLAVYARVLYGQALLLEGLPLDDPAAFSADLCRLL